MSTNLQINSPDRENLCVAVDPKIDMVTRAFLLFDRGGYRISEREESG